MLHFATLFDSNYLSRGLALYESLLEQCSEPFRLYVLAIDDIAANFFQAHSLENIAIVKLDEIERRYPELLVAKQNRSKIEYYFTLSPVLPLYILESFEDVCQVTSMDADLYFFADPTIIFKAYSQASILITPHNFCNDLLHLERYGKYNVSFQSFRNNDMGIKCLQKWKQDCIEWCYDYFDDNKKRFADQKYLDNWVDEYGAVPIQLPGAGVAPWNIDQYEYAISNSKLLVNKDALIYFHFHHLRIFNKYFAMHGLDVYKVKTPKKMLKEIYHRYLKRLNQITGQYSLVVNSIARNNSKNDKSLAYKLVRFDGYWFFTSFFMRHINLYAALKKYRKLKFW